MMGPGFELRLGDFTNWAPSTDMGCSGCQALELGEAYEEGSDLFLF